MAPSPPPAPLTALDARVQRAVEWMNDDERRVVWLRHSEDLPWATIAERLGTPPERVGAVLLDASYHVDEVVQGSDPPPERTRQCRPARQAFFARFDGQPVDPVAYAAAREHAAGCPNCTRARIALRRAQIALGAWTPVPFAEPAAAAAAPAAAPALPATPPAVRRRPPAPARTGTGRSRRPVAVAATLAAGAGAVALTAGALGGDSAPSRAAEAVSTATPTPTPTLVPAERTERREKKREEKADEPRRKPRKRAAAKPAATPEATPTTTPTPTPTPRSTPQPDRPETQRREQAERRPQPTATPRPTSTPAPTRTATPKPEPIPGDPNGDVIPPP